MEKCPSLSNTVMAIVRIRSEKKMIRPNTQGSIAFMKDPQVPRNRAMRENPCQPMTGDIPTVVPNLPTSLIAGTMDASVRPRPDPATIRLSDARPKTFLYGNRNESLLSLPSVTWLQVPSPIL